MQDKVGIVAIQCTTSTGERGTFLFEHGANGERVPLSPVFNSLAYLYPWLAMNGWERVHGSKEPTGEFRKR